MLIANSQVMLFTFDNKPAQDKCKSQKSFNNIEI